MVGWGVCFSLFCVVRCWRLEVARAVSQSGRRCALAEEFVNLRAFQKSPIANCRRHEREMEFGGTFVVSVELDDAERCDDVCASKYLITNSHNPSLLLVSILEYQRKVGSDQ